MTLEVYTGATPNGWKITVMIEELIEAGIELGKVNMHRMNLSDGDQFTEDFMKINPNQKIPAIVHNGKSIIESCARYSVTSPRVVRAAQCLPRRTWRLRRSGKHMRTTRIASLSDDSLRRCAG